MPLDCPTLLEIERGWIFVSGWDDLFNKCSENLNSLVAMKLSPYYKGDLSLYCLRSRTELFP
jgi:hypothetical protein